MGEFLDWNTDQFMSMMKGSEGGQPLTCLKELNIGGSVGMGPQLPGLFSLCEGLTSLSLAGCKDITDEQVISS